jgi:protein-disulfide isomerase
MSKESKIMIGVIGGIIVIMLGLFYLAGGKDTKNPKTTAKADEATLIKSDSHTSGNGSIKLVEFGDYQCPACGAAYPNIKKIQSEYGDKITFVFRNYPLTQVHKNADLAAQAAEAAGSQNKYWEMHDKLYDTQAAWSETDNAKDLITGYAKDLGLDVDKFTNDLTSQSIKDRIAADVADGDKIQVNSTPTLYVGTTMISNYSYDTIKTAIDEALKSQG